MKTTEPSLANLKIKPIFFASIFIIFLFLFLRFYKIQTSLLFYGDLGRDFLVIHDFLTTKKPPLLGPQTSALPFNQSAIYFYLLIPMYLLSGRSLFSTLYTNAIFYIALFVIGVIFLKKHPKLQKSLLIVFFLISIHPQHVIQSRYVWNPSFVTGCIITAFYLFQILQKEFNKKLAFIFTFCLALATAFSYSVAPVLIAFLLVSIPIFKKNSLLFFIYSFINLALVNFPTIIFELRHNFPLTQMMIFQEKLPQPGKSLADKLFHLDTYFLSIDNIFIKVLLLILLIGLTVRQIKAKSNNNFLISITLFTISLVITLLLPVSIHSHYIFGILSLLFISISFLEKGRTLIILILFFSYITPKNLQAYFKPSHRTAIKSLKCATDFCSQFNQPTFISSQNGYSPGHNAMGFKYLFKRSGCEIKSLDNEIDQASHMLVVSDNSIYEHGKTVYNELTQFGPSQEIGVFNCSDDLKIHILEKN